MRYWNASESIGQAGGDGAEAPDDAGPQGDQRGEQRHGRGWPTVPVGVVVPSSSSVSRRSVCRSASSPTGSDSAFCAGVRHSCGSGRPPARETPGFAAQIRSDEAEAAQFAMMATMTTSRASTDAIVIGAGVIGASVALELSRGGRTVVCVDKGPAAGAGSTSASSAIIRFSYSTLDAVLTAWEAAALWRDWAGHLGIADPRRDGPLRPRREPDLLHAGLRRRRRSWRCGTTSASRTSASMRRLRERFPGLDVGRYYPPKRVDDPAFADDATAELTAFYNARQRVHRRPDARRPQPGQRRATPRRRVPLPQPRSRRSTAPAVTGHGRDAGVGRTHLSAGGRQRGRPALDGHQRDGRRHGRHAHQPPAAAPGGFRRARAGRARARRRRPDRRRPRHRPVLPPAGGRHAAGRRHGT